MNKAVIHYFSGTGNSLLAAKQIADKLSGYNYDIAFHCIEEGPCARMEDYSLHIFFFPVYATGMPHIMGKYIRRLPNGKKTKAAVISTNGKISTKYRDGYQGWALHQARLYLKRKNYDVFFSETLDYPHNVTFVLPPGEDKNNQIIIDQASERIADIAKRMAENQVYHRRCFYPNFLWCIPFSLLYSLLGRRFLSKIFAADTSCNHCKICMHKCPVKAIDADHKVVRWRMNCEGCLRCINSCPQKAIQTSVIRIAVMVLAIIANPFMLLYRYIPDWLNGIPDTIYAGIIHTLFYLVTASLIVLIMDWVLYYLSYIPLCKKIIGFGHTKFFGRYQAKKFE